LKRTNRLILLIGVLLAVVAFVGIIVVFNNQPGGGSATQAPTTKPVVVATRDIALGDTVKKDMVGTKDVPIDQVTPDKYQDTGLVIGQVARQNITNGAIVVQTMFSGTGAPMIGSDLPAGMRAIAVKVDALTGVGTLILPGDRVDVVATLPFKVTAPNAPVESAAPGATASATWVVSQDPAESTKVVLQNVEVRAVLGSGFAGVASTGTPELGTFQQIVILGVTTQQAEVLENLGVVATAAQGQGAGTNVTLILRSPLDKDAPDVKTTGIVLQTLIEKYGILPPLPFEVTASPRP
jgi:Flp pilus assembly protein CpaB